VSIVSLLSVVKPPILVPLIYPRENIIILEKSIENHNYYNKIIYGEDQHPIQFVILPRYKSVKIGGDIYNSPHMILYR